MSAIAYNEPYKFSAGFLTLVVHAIFFSALYFGVNWSEQQPEGMEVTLWQSLPSADSRQAASVQPAEVKPAPPQKVEPVNQKEAEMPAPPAKADINMSEIRKKPGVKPNEVVKAEPKKPLLKSDQRRLQNEMQDIFKQQELNDQQDQARRDAQAAQAAAAAAAITSEIGKYKGLISAKIRRNIVNPPDVADDAAAEFVVTLLPDGGLLDVKLRKSSGNTAYDDAVERAIWKAEPLPLPPDETARKQFVNPNHPLLKFSPKDKE